MICCTNDYPRTAEYLRIHRVRIQAEMDGGLSGIKLLVQTRNFIFGDTPAHRPGFLTAWLDFFNAKVWEYAFEHFDIYTDPC